VATGLGLRRADGVEFRVDIRLSPFEIDGHKLAMVAIRDATERERAERERDNAENELRLAVERYRDLSLTLEQRVEERASEVLQRGRKLDETDRKLHEANKVFTAMSERGGIFMARLNLLGEVVDANRACVEELGFARVEIMGKPFWKGGWWRKVPKLEQRIRTAFEHALAGDRFRAETTYFLGNGEERVSDNAMIPITDDTGRVTSVFAVGLDVTERARRYRAMFENAAVGIAHISNDLKWVRVNEALCDTIGYRPGELLTRPISDVIHPDDRDATLAAMDDLCRGAIDSFDAEKRYLRKDGGDIWVRDSVGCVRKGDGSFDYFVAVILDISGRKHAEEEFHRSEERFKTAVLRSPVPLLLFDEGERILAASESWLQESGSSMDHLRTISDWTARAYRENSGEVLKYLRDIIAENPEILRRDLTIRTRGGVNRHWSLVASALGSQSDGRRQFIAAAQDITERKSYEEHIELLMREARHRTKNILTLVQSVARQTVAHDPERFLQSFCERIGALAANQELLVKNQWHGADVEDLVRGQLAHFTDLIGSRIVMRGPKLRLNAAAAQAVGLAVHELATNAGKYGALSTDSGDVAVDWRIDADSFAITWTERGGPPVVPPGRRGFGSTVIESLAKTAVSGEVALDYAPSGLRWHLTCTKGNALEERDPPATAPPRRSRRGAPPSVIPPPA